MSDPIQLSRDDCVVEVELTPEQAARAECLQHDIWCNADAHDAAREIIFLRDQLTDLRASLRHEENAREIAVREVGRLRARISELEMPPKLEATS